MRNKLILAALAAAPLAAALASPPLATAAPARPPAFAKCAACHNVARGGPNGIGPNLHGVVGRRAGAVPGYAYSPALRAGRVTWTRPALDRYIANPDAVAPGGKMPAVAATPAERQAIVAWLAGLK